MRSRENLVLLGSLVVFLLTFAAVGAVGVESAVVTFAVVAGVGVLGPQLVLAAVDDSVSPRGRVRIGVLLTLVIAGLTVGSADPFERRVIGTVAAALFVGLVGWEFVGGYRSSEH